MELLRHLDIRSKDLVCRKTKRHRLVFRDDGLKSHHPETRAMLNWMKNPKHVPTNRANATEQSQTSLERRNLARWMALHTKQNVRVGDNGDTKSIFKYMKSKGMGSIAWTQTWGYDTYQRTGLSQGSTRLMSQGLTEDPSMGYYSAPKELRESTFTQIGKMYLTGKHTGLQNARDAMMLAKWVTMDYRVHPSCPVYKWITNSQENPVAPIAYFFYYLEGNQKMRGALEKRGAIKPVSDSENDMFNLIFLKQVCKKIARWRDWKQSKSQQMAYINEQGDIAATTSVRWYTPEERIEGEVCLSLSEPSDAYYNDITQLNGSNLGCCKLCRHCGTLNIKQDLLYKPSIDVEENQWWSEEENYCAECHSYLDMPDQEWEDAHNVEDVVNYFISANVGSKVDEMGLMNYLDGVDWLGASNTKSNIKAHDLLIVNSALSRFNYTTVLTGPGVSHGNLLKLHDGFPHIQFADGAGEFVPGPTFRACKDAMVSLTELLTRRDQHIHVPGMDMVRNIINNDRFTTQLEKASVSLIDGTEESLNLHSLLSHQKHNDLFVILLSTSGPAEVVQGETWLANHAGTNLMVHAGSSRATNFTSIDSPGWSDRGMISYENSCFSSRVVITHGPLSLVHYSSVKSKKAVMMQWILSEGDKIKTMKVPTINNHALLTKAGLPIIEMEELTLHKALINSLLARAVAGKATYEELVEYGIAFARSRYSLQDETVSYRDVSFEQVSRHAWVAHCLMARAHAKTWTTSFMASAEGLMGLGLRSTVTVSNWLLKAAHSALPDNLSAALQEALNVNATQITRGRDSPVWDELDIWLNTRHAYISRGFNEQIEINACGHHNGGPCNCPITSHTCNCCGQPTATDSGRCLGCQPKNPSCTHKPTNVDFKGMVICYCCGLPFTQGCDNCPPMIAEVDSEDEYELRSKRSIKNPKTITKQERKPPSNKAQIVEEPALLTTQQPTTLVSSESKPRDYASAATPKSAKQPESVTQTKEELEDYLVAANREFTPEENIVLFSGKDCNTDLLYSGSNNKYAIYLHHCPMGEIVTMSNNFTLLGFDNTVQPGNQCGHYSFSICTDGIGKISDFNKVLGVAGPYSDQHLLRMARHYNLNIILYGGTFTTVQTMVPGEQHYTIQHIKDERFKDGHWRPCTLSVRKRWTDKLSIATMFNQQELDSLTSEALGEKKHYSTELLEPRDLYTASKHIKDCAGMLTSNVQSTLPQLTERKGQWYLSNGNTTDIARGLINQPVPGWALGALEPINFDINDKVKHLTVRGAVDSTADSVVNVDATLDGVINLACHDIIRTRLLPEQDVNSNLKSSVKIIDLPTRTLSSGILAINLEGTRLKQLDEIYVKEWKTIISVRVKMIEGTPFCITPMKSSLKKGVVRVAVPSSSVGSAWRVIIAALTTNVTQGHFDMTLKHMRGVSAIFGWGKSTTMENGRHEHNRGAMTRGAQTVLKGKLIESGNLATRAKPGAIVMSAEAASMRKVVTKRLIVDEASKLGPAQLLMMLTDKVEEVVLFGDHLQIGARDMNATPGERVATSCLDLCNNVEIYKHTRRLGAPLAEELKKIPALQDLTYDAKITNFSTTTTSKYDSTMINYLVQQYQIDTVLTHYQEMAAMLRHDLTNMVKEGTLVVSTIDSFQGQESERVLIVASPTANGTRHLVDDFEFNVSAASRARSYLHWWSINCHQESTPLHLRILGSMVGAGMPGGFPDEDGHDDMMDNHIIAEELNVNIATETMQTLEHVLRTKTKEFGCTYKLCNNPSNLEIHIIKNFGPLSTTMATYMWNHEAKTSTLSVSALAPISALESEALRRQMDKFMEKTNPQPDEEQEIAKTKKCCHSPSAAETYNEDIYFSTTTSYKLKNLAYLCQQFQSTGNKLGLYTNTGVLVELTSGGGCSSCGGITGRRVDGTMIIKLSSDYQRLGKRGITVGQDEDVLANSIIIMVGGYRGPTDAWINTVPIDDILRSRYVCAINIFERALTLGVQTVMDIAKADSPLTLENRYQNVNSQHLSEGERLKNSLLTSCGLDNNIHEWFDMSNKLMGHMKTDHLPWVYRTTDGSFTLAFTPKTGSLLQRHEPSDYRQIILDCIRAHIDKTSIIKEVQAIISDIHSKRKVGARINGLLQPISQHKDAGDEIYKTLQNFAAKAELGKLKHMPKPVFMTRMGMNMMGDAINEMHPKLAVQEHNMTHGHDPLGQARETAANACRRRDRNNVDILTQRPSVYFVNSWFNSNLMTPNDEDLHKHWFDSEMGLCYNVLSNIAGRIGAREKIDETSSAMKIAVESYKNQSMQPFISKEKQHKALEMNDVWCTMTPGEIISKIIDHGCKEATGWFSYDFDGTHQALNLPGKGMARSQCLTGQDIPSVLLDSHFEMITTGRVNKTKHEEHTLLIEKQSTFSGVHLVKLMVDNTRDKFYHIDHQVVGRSTINVTIPALHPNIVKGITTGQPLLTKKHCVMDKKLLEAMIMRRARLSCSFDDLLEYGRSQMMTRYYTTRGVQDKFSLTTEKCHDMAVAAWCAGGALTHDITSYKNYNLEKEFTPQLLETIKQVCWSNVNYSADKLAGVASMAMTMFGGKLSEFDLGDLVKSLDITNTMGTATEILQSMQLWKVNLHSGHGKIVKIANAPLNVVEQETKRSGPVLIAGMGTYGDVAIMRQVKKMVEQAGLSTVLAVPKTYCSPSEVSLNFDAIEAANEARMLIENPLKLIKQMLNGKRFMFADDVVDKLSDVESPSLIITNAVSPQVHMYAKANNIPTIMLNGMIMRGHLFPSLEKYDLTVPDCATKTALSMVWSMAVREQQEYHNSEGKNTKGWESHATTTILSHPLFMQIESDSPTVKNAGYLGYNDTEGLQEEDVPTHILFTMGSMRGKAVSTLMERVSHVSKTLHMQLLIIEGAEPVPARLRMEEHVIVRGRTPLESVTPHSRFAITHGGTGTIATLICEKVPTILVPTIGDQFVWASHYANAQLATSMSIESNIKEIEKACRSIMLSPVMRRLQGIRHLTTLERSMEHGRKVIFQALLEQGLEVKEMVSANTQQRQNKKPKPMPVVQPMTKIVPKHVRQMAFDLVHDLEPLDQDLNMACCGQKQTNDTIIGQSEENDCFITFNHKEKLISWVTRKHEVSWRQMSFHRQLGHPWVSTLNNHSHGRVLFAGVKLKWLRSIVLPANQPVDISITEWERLSNRESRKFNDNGALEKITKKGVCSYCKRTRHMMHDGLCKNCSSDKNFLQPGAEELIFSLGMSDEELPVMAKTHGFVAETLPADSHEEEDLDLTGMLAPTTPSHNLGIMTDFHHTPVPPGVYKTGPILHTILYDPVGTNDTCVLDCLKFSLDINRAAAGFDNIRSFITAPGGVNQGEIVGLFLACGLNLVLHTDTETTAYIMDSKLPLAKVKLVDGTRISHLLVVESNIRWICKERITAQQQDHKVYDITEPIHTITGADIKTINDASELMQSILDPDNNSEASRNLTARLKMSNYKSVNKEETTAWL
nr:TPA_asm: RNA-dependent RNA polymerase [Alphaendornavirus fimbriatae-1]